MTAKSKPSSRPGKALSDAAVQKLKPLGGRLRRLAARRRMWLHVAQGLGVLAVIVALLLGGAVYRLSQGPVSVAFLTPRIVEAVQQQLPPGFTASVADTVIERESETGHVLLRLRDIAVNGPTGAPIFAAPRASISLSGVGLLVGRVTPRSVSLIRPSVTLVEEGGRLRLRTGADQPATPGASRMASPVEAFAALFGMLGYAGDDWSGGLTAIGARGAKISVEYTDGGIGGSDFVDVSVFRGSEPGHAGFSVALGRDTGAPQLEGVLKRRPDGAFEISGELSNVATTDIVPFVPGGLPVVLTGPVSGRLSALIDSKGGFDRLSGALRVGAGFVGSGEARILVDEADIAFEWKYSSGVINIRPSHILIGNSHGTMSGQIAIPRPGEFSYGTVPLRLEFSDVFIDDPETGAPAALDSASLEAFYVTSQKVVHISRLDVAGGGTAGSFVGFIGGTGESPGVRLAGSVTPTTVEGLKSVWPPFVASKARRWFVNNAVSGRIENGRLNVDIDPGGIAAAMRQVPLPRDAFEIAFSVREGSFHFLGQMPPISGVDAEGVVDGLEFVLTTNAPARVELPDNSVVDVPHGRFFVPDIPSKPSSGELDIELAGNIKDVLRLLDFPPIELARRRNLDVDGFGGQGTFAFQLGMPLIDGLRFSDIDLSVSGKIKDFSAANFAGAHNVKDGNIEVTVSDGRVVIAGDALVEGVRAEVALEDSIDGGGAPGARSVTMTLDEEARARLGMPLDAILSGPIVATVTDVKASASGTSQVIEADLTDASVSFAALGIDKPAGEPAKANFKLTQSGKTIKLSDLRVEAGSMRVEGEADFIKDGGLTRINLPVLRTPRGTDLSIAGTTQSGIRTIKLKGAAIDLRGMLGSIGDVADASSDASSERMDIEIDVARAIGMGGVELSNLQGTVRRVGDRVERLDVSASTSNSVPVSVRYSDDGANADLSVDSADAGWVLAWAGYYPNMRGGQLRLVASRRGAEAPLAGSIAIDKFRIANDPSLERLIQGGEKEASSRSEIAATTSRGEIQRVNAADVGFDRLTAKFERGAGDMRVKEGALRGLAVGASFEGSINFAAEQINLHGTYVPLYALNNLFGQLPLFLGPLLGGNKNEGLLGITYSLSGSTKSPVLTINPMSVVAPGVFRYIFGMDNPQAPPRSGSGSEKSRINR